ncbi:MAG: hypothetical protein DI535_07570 [Citrobacter freundii]|nr:MAG: hypothetical protein DI535_07570 [Citrobacter freundii]
MKNQASVNRFFKRGDKTLLVLFFVSFISTWLVTDLYRETIIEFKYLIAIFMLGALAFVIISKMFIKGGFSKLMLFLPDIFIGGMLACFVMLFLNRQFAENEVLNESVKITKKGSLSRGKYSSCSQPYVIVELSGMNKRFEFLCSEIADVRKSYKMKVNYSKGLFDFWVIRSRYLME